MYDTAIKRFWQTNCSILDFEIDDIPLDVNDLKLNTKDLQHITNTDEK